MTDKKIQRIALFLPNLAVGGAEKVYIQLANQFAARGKVVDLLLLKKEGGFVSEVSPLVNVIDMKLPNAYFSLLKLISYLKEFQPQYLLSALELTSWMAIMAGRLSGIPTRNIVSLTTAISQSKRSYFKKKLERWLIAWLYSKAYKVIPVSKDTEQDLLAHVHLPAELIETIYTPIISDELITSSYQDITHPYFQDGQPPVILGMGRLSIPKDFPSLIRAFEKVRKLIPAHLLILGEGQERPALENLINSLGLEKDVMLPGFVQNPYPFMRRASVFALSSSWEGLPSVLIEALACDCPAVSTDCRTGPREILAEGKYGHLVPVKDPDALAQAIIKSLQGDKRKPPPEWLDKFRVEPVVQKYLNIMGYE